jgi:Mrp family chromosome partitioning ATPase
MSDEAVAIAEKLVIRLPREGGALLVGSVGRESELSQHLALAFQVISSRPTLWIEFAARSERTAAGRKPGLLEVLGGEITFEEAITNVNGVAVLRYGAESALKPELIASNAFREFLDQTSTKFPWIILSCPHIFKFEERASLISRADGVVLALERGLGTGEDLESMQSLCRELKTEFFGVVLT